MSTTLNPEILQVAVASMNATHAREHEILMRLVVAFEEDDETLASAISAFRQHVHAHFAREEALMEQYGFPPYLIHKSEHDRLRARLERLCVNWRAPEGRAALRRFAEIEYPSWLRQHVATMDTATAHFLAMHGVE